MFAPCLDSHVKNHASKHDVSPASLAHATPPPASGSVQVRVRYCECDPMNVAHHAAYIPWLEIGRTELLRASGVSYAQLEASGVFLVIAKLDARYRKPVFYDDVVEVRTRVAETSAVKIVHEYEVVVVEHAGQACETLCAAASTTLACVDREGKVRQLPEWLRTSR
ncbi:MAG: YbgC/FadM family acyl-CoA thioesterase [Tepidisphaera sp.]|nr:YbgC/FadM family acyl-CoA thioesterase [Tepidisphaera sp.]